MRYTFGDAKRILTGVAHSKMTDVGGKINDAIAALCGANPWEHEFLRRTVRIISAAPVISLPQGAAGLVRACVNGVPSSIRGQDFRFLSSGPGNPLSYPRRGYSPFSPDDLDDMGESPVWWQPDFPSRLSATHSGANAQPDLVVKGTDENGDAVTMRLQTYPESETPVYDERLMRTVDEVVLGEGTDAYVSLVCEGRDGPVVLGRYHPNYRVPAFRQYAVRTRFPHRGPFEIVAEVQMDPVPLVSDDDVVPFPTLEPIRYMMLYAWNRENLEESAAEKNLEKAMQWLTRFNSAKNTTQTATVMNVPYNGSMGELSSWMMNL